MVGAIKSGDTNQAMELISKASPESLNTPTGTALPLHEAIRQNNLILVEKLLSLGADPNKPEIAANKAPGLTPLRVALSKKNADAAKLLIANKANPFDISAADSSSPLSTAIKEGQSDMALVMLDSPLAETELAKPAGVNSILLHIAAQQNNTDVIKRLLELKIGINSLDGNGDTALIIAASNGCDETANFLMDNGADVTIFDKKKYCALHLACSASKGNEIATIKRILDLGKYEPLPPPKSDLEKAARGIFISPTDIDLRSGQGKTPLRYAISNDNAEACKLLLDRGADPNRVDIEGNSVLMFACADLSADCVNLLLREGADAKYRNKQTSMDAISTLVFSCEPAYESGEGYDFEKFKKIFTALSGKGADINGSYTDVNLTIIQLACSFADVQMVKYLMENKADLHLNRSQFDMKTIIGNSCRDDKGKGALPEKFVKGCNEIYNIYINTY
jgi:ankyrin repeat protein